MKLATVTIAGLLLMAGCHKPAISMDPTVRTIPLTSDHDLDRHWTAASSVLRRHFFEIDRLDVASGTIKTRPMTSQQAFEFWRCDVATPYDLVDSTLNPIRRVATVHIGPASNGEASMTVVVQKQRLSRPEREYNNSVAALNIFGDQLPGAAGEYRLTREDETWIDQGRDPAMERYLLQGILDTAQVTISP